MFSLAMNNKKHVLKVFFGALSVLLAVIMILKNPEGPLPALSPVLTEQAEQHLLYGDKRGGGHLYGTGKPCKSEFPADWDEGEVINHVKQVAANDNLDWEQQRNGYFVAEEMVESTRVRVVLNQNRTKIVTAYPTNVKRNDCPRVANDNNPD